MKMQSVDFDIAQMHRLRCIDLLSCHGLLEAPNPELHGNYISAVWLKREVMRARQDRKGNRGGVLTHIYIK